MKKTALILLCNFILAACNSVSKKENKEEKEEEITSVGGTKDEKGCLVSAGETWSEIKQSCVQIFNIAQRLNPIHPNEGEAIMSAFVLFDDEQSELELFLPDNENTSILTLKDNGVYEADEYQYNSQDSTLYVNDEATFKAVVPIE